MRKTVLSILCLATWFGAARLGFAGSEMKPVATVAIAGYDRMKADLGVIGRLSGNPHIADGLEKMLKVMTRGKGLAGLDVRRPWGAGRFGDTVYGFVPVTDLKQMMEAAKSYRNLAGAIQRDGDVYQIKTSRWTVYVQQKGDWAVVTTSRASLAQTPTDPLKLFGDLSKGDSLAARVSVKEIPAGPGRDKLLASFLGMVGITPATDDDDTGSSRCIERSIATRLDDLDYVTLRLKIDPGVGKAYFDLDIVPKCGTKLAGRLAGMKPGKTAFAGMSVLGADAMGIVAGSLSTDDVAKVKEKLAAIQKRFLVELMQQDLSDEQLESVTRLSVDVLDVLKKTLDTKKIDVGCASQLVPGGATVVVGAAVVDGDKLEKSVKRLIDDLRKSDPELAAMFKLRVDTYKGVSVYGLSMPTPVPELAPVCGEKLKVVFAAAVDKVLVGIGRDADKMLKKILDGSKTEAGKEVPPIRIKLTPGKVANFIAEVASDDDIKLKAAMVGMALDKAGKKNHIVITASPISQGMHVRIEMEEGLLKTMAAIGQMVIPLGVVPSSEPADSSE